MKLRFVSDVNIMLFYFMLTSEILCSISRIFAYLITHSVVIKLPDYFLKKNRL